MTEDFRDELHELREQNDREIQALEAATPPRIEREGSDELDVVSVRIGPDGDVRDVRVAHNWRDRVEGEALGDAIRAALVRAQASVVDEFITNVEAADPDRLPPPRPMPMPQDSGEVFGLTGSVSPEEAERIMAEIFGGAEQALAALESSLDAASIHSASSRSRHGEVHVEIDSGGDVSRLDLDPRWLAGAHPANVGRLVGETLRDAQQQMMTGFGAVSDAARETQHRMRRLGDPYTLSRRFGLQR
ncbi:hypothetical protein [Knoellia sinensis]|uniref:hypothetical protein n=1 Tax=Knoellia sinensis TaxID=136100 RepID=UPI000ADCD970|nr:hypothetical protein [Knoellia sinensis]